MAVIQPGADFDTLDFHPGVATLPPVPNCLSPFLADSVATLPEMPVKDAFDISVEQ